MKLDLSNEVALVTGGSRGIGRECGLSLARAGARVIVNYNRSQPKAEEVRDKVTEIGSDADIYQGDVSKLEEVKGLFDFVREKYDRLDILVNNAGVIKDTLLLNTEVSDWERVHDVNLKGAFLCTKFAVEMMMPNHYGKIINIASVSAIRGGKGQTNYASSKGGLISFTRACALELAEKGIRVNAILPGIISTAMSSRVRKKAGDRILERIPTLRFGEPADIANLVVFLAAEKSDYITGQAICVDGGLSIS
jgi:3-oxoacyl-[acyl-carrier protein] reductase